MKLAILVTADRHLIWTVLPPFAVSTAPLARLPLIMPGFSFGSYSFICDEVAMVVCPLLGSSGLGLEPICYSRNVEINKTSSSSPQPASSTSPHSS